MLLQPGMSLFPHTLASVLVWGGSTVVGLMNSAIMLKKKSNRVLQRMK